MSQAVPRHTHYSSFSYYGNNEVSSENVWIRPFGGTYKNGGGGTAKIICFKSPDTFVESVDSSPSQYAQTGVYGSGNYVRPNSSRTVFLVKY